VVVYAEAYGWTLPQVMALTPSQDRALGAAASRIRNRRSRKGARPGDGWEEYDRVVSGP
jgi:hypothetical protein